MRELNRRNHPEVYCSRLAARGEILPRIGRIADISNVERTGKIVSAATGNDQEGNV